MFRRCRYRSEVNVLIRQNPTAYLFVEARVEGSGDGRSHLNLIGEIFGCYISLDPAPPATLNVPLGLSIFRKSTNTFKFNW